jgi:1-acyl-sn-glycerol-3-phosphate acyltransferase
MMRILSNQPGGAASRSGGRRGAARADEVERAFAHPSTRLLRPLVVSTLFLVTTARRIRWQAEAPLEAGHDGRPLILAANHQSHVDTPAILWCLPPALRGRTAVAAASDTFGPDGSGWAPARRGLQRVVTAGFRAYPFDRRPPVTESLGVSAELLRRGWSLLMFPEGTRVRGGRIAAFRPGIGWLARETGARVVPVHVDGGARVLPPGAFWPSSGLVSVRFGSPLPYDPALGTEGFTLQVEGAVRGLAGDRRVSA